MLSLDDESYQKVGAQIKTRAEVIQSSEIILSIQSPGKMMKIFKFQIKNFDRRLLSTL